MIHLERDFLVLVLVLMSGVIFSVDASAASAVCSGIANSVPEFDSTTKKFKGCRLESVEPGSSYAKLGLKKGSILYPTTGPGGQGEEITLDLANSETATVSSEEAPKSRSAESGSCSKDAKGGGEGCPGGRIEFLEE